MSDLGKSDLSRIKTNKKVSDLLISLLYKKEHLSYDDAFFLYSFVHFLIQEYEKKPQKKFLLEYAYYITALVSFKTSDFNALYDFSINLGFYPLSRKLFNLELSSNSSVLDLFANIEIEDYVDKGKVLTFEQKSTFNKILESKHNSISFIAPTSYGKSELILEIISRDHEVDKIAIIVPTKSLINQVYNDFKKQETLHRKIIIHDQNYKPEDDHRILAIITQERGLRLIEKGITFDLVFIDEAHELMRFDFSPNVSNRSLLLTRFIRLSCLKNSELKLYYLSPLIIDSNNLRYKGQNTIETHRIDRDLKLYQINYLDKNARCSLYDKYLGTFIDREGFSNAFEFIDKNMKSKNLHFLYRPIFIEKYAHLLYTNLRKRNDDIPSDVNELISELKEFIHPLFKMAKYLEKGIVYLHAKIPLIIRNYIIMFVNKSSFIKHFIANSVILAGMNLKIDCLFYISGYANINDLINLMGRVNRLNEIFSKDNSDLSKIFIPVNFMELDEFPQAKNGSMKKKIEKLRSKLFDDVKNPLLENSYITNSNKDKAEKIIESETHILDNYDKDDFYTILSKTGAQGLLNYSKQGLIKLNHKIELINSIPNEEIMDNLKTIFFDDYTHLEDYEPQQNVFRLQHQDTIEYYKMFMEKMKTLPLKARIEDLVNYWKKKRETNHQVYIGSSFGEEVYESKIYHGFNKVYINVNKYIDEAEKIYNIAIIKLQIDEEFVSHEIVILLTTLLEFNLITEDQYNYLVYGTNNREELFALEIGLSRSTFLKMKADDQIININFDEFGNPYANHELTNYINRQKGIYKFELDLYFTNK